MACKGVSSQITGIPPPVNPDGSLRPPPTVDNTGKPIVPSGRNTGGRPNQWVPEANSKPRDGSPRYKLKDPPPPPDEGGPKSPPNASWDGRNGHWDFNDGNGNRSRRLDDGTLVDHWNSPIAPRLSVPLPAELEPGWPHCDCGPQRSGPSAVPWMWPSSVPMTAPAPGEAPDLVPVFEF
jgi:hypothetical protein